MVLSTEFSVLEVTLKDTAQILDCLREAFAPFRSAYTPEAFLDTVLTPTTLEQRFKTMTMFVAVSCVKDDGPGDGRASYDRHGDIVGTVGCELTPSGEGHLRGMAVRLGWQGAGVAGELLQHAEAELARHGCTRIT